MVNEVKQQVGRREDSYHLDVGGDGPVKTFLRYGHRSRNLKL